MDTTNSITGTGTTGTTASTVTNKNQVMGKDDFLKILMAQMSHMDPMSPDSQDPTQSIAQMAQFSIVEQLTNLTKSNEQTTAMGMLGKTVTYQNPKTGVSSQGVVQSVDTSGGDPTLTVDGVSSIAIATVTEVR
jgi:flagellar basal-body rod modification protein FlgD